MRRRGLTLFVALALSCAHAPDPEPVRVTRRHLARGDAPSAVASYKDWRRTRGSDDRALLRTMAVGTVWLGLTAPDAAIRRRAIGLAETHELEQLAESVARRLGDDDQVVRAAAAGALLRSHPDAPDILAEAIDSESADARRIAYDALGRKVGEPARGELTAGLADRDPGVRRTVCSALARTGREAAGSVAEQAAKDTDGSVRAACLRAAVELRAAAALVTARASVGAEFLGLRLAAVDAIDVLGEAGATPELQKLAAGDDPYVALRAAVALHRRGAPVGTEPLTRALADARWTVRATALNVAAQLLAPDAAVKAVTPLATDAVADVRLAAARALLRLGQAPAATALLATLADDARVDVRAHAAAELARLGVPKGASVLAMLARQGDAATRALAVSLLATDAFVPDALVDALADPSPDVRLAAAERLLRDR